MAHQVEKVVDCFRYVARAATATGASIVSREGNMIGVSTTWSQRNPDRKMNMTSELHQSIDLNTGGVINIGPALDVSGQLLSKYSPSGKLRAVLREGASAGSSSKEPKKQFIEIWSAHSMVHQFDLNRFSLHGEIYTDAEFGCFEWSSCETKLLYTAEKKVPKAVSFLAATAKDGNSDDIVPGSEYVYSQDWGEKLVDKVWSILAIADMSTSDIKVVLGDTLDKSGLVLSSGVWLPNGDSIVAVRHDVKPRKLGKIYCSNRPSSVVHINLTTNEIECLSGEGFATSSPRVTPDGSKVVWMERLTDGPHLTCHKLMSYSFRDKQKKVVVDVVKTMAKCVGGQPFYGLYNMFLSNSWLSDNKTLILNTPQKCSLKTYAVDIDNGSITEIGGSDEWSHGLLHVSGNIILCWKSNLNHRHGVVMADASDMSKLKWIELVKPTAIDVNYKFEIQHLQSSNSQDAFRDYNAIYFGPKEGSNVPLIVWSHGGPHSAFPNTYNMEAHFFAKLGFAMVMVNYRGSVGAGAASVEWLPGRVGSSDVSDVHSAREAILASFPELNKSECLAYGGSHGGFLTLHLIGQFPDKFKCCASINPVCSLGDFSSSDIPDWAFTEGGIGLYDVKEPRTLTGTDVDKMAAMSPQRYVKNVTAAVLLLLGKQDLRVPHSQGLNYYHALKAAGKAESKLLMYDDNHSLQQSANETDFLINTGLWFLKYAGKS